MANWEAKTVSDVIDDINEQKIVLPVIQRNLVWDEDKMELLFDSLLKGHSFGGIIAVVEPSGMEPLFAFRLFSKEGELQDSELHTVVDHETMLIIDGQQRLQSFYMGLIGGLNSKKLYFNLYSKEDYEFEFASQINDLPPSQKEDGVEALTLWYPVTTLYISLKRYNDDRKVAKEIIKNRNIIDNDLSELVYDNVDKFDRAIFGHKAIGISQVFVDKDHPEGERRRMVELFRRLNDGGTRLSALELAASTLKGFNPNLEIFLRREVSKYADIGFRQDEVVKLLFLLQDNTVKEVTDITKEDADFAVANSVRILKSLDVVRRVLKHAELYEYYQGSGRSVIPLYAIAYHIFHKNINDSERDALYADHDINNPDFTNIKRWLSFSLLNGVFGKGKGWIPYRTGIRKILGVLSLYKNKAFPTDALFNVYENHPLIFSEDLDVSQINRWDHDFAFYLMYNCHSLTGRDVDHVHPKSLLEQAQVPGDKIHTINNYQLLDIETNRNDKRAKPFSDWLLQQNWAEIERQQYLARHLIPTNAMLWSIDNYDAFLQARSNLILEKVSQFIPTTSNPPQAESNLPPQAPIDNRAAWLSKEARNPETWLSGLADQKGIGKEFRLIVEAARSSGLYARFQNNWWIVQFTPTENRNRGLFDLSSELGIWLYADRIAEYTGFTIDIVNAKLNFGDRIDSPLVDQWIKNFLELFGSKKRE